MFAHNGANGPKNYYIHVSVRSPFLANISATNYSLLISVHHIDNKLFTVSGVVRLEIRFVFKRN